MKAIRQYRAIVLLLASRMGVLWDHPEVYEQMWTCGQIKRDTLPDMLESENKLFEADKKD